MNRRKKETLYDLARDLHGAGFTPPQIAEALGYSDDRIREVLTDVGLARPRRSLRVAMRCLEPQLRRQVNAFREWKERESRPDRARGRAASADVVEGQPSA